MTGGAVNGGYMLAGGYHEEDFEIWSAGILAAQPRQLAMVLPL